MKKNVAHFKYIYGIDFHFVFIYSVLWNTVVKLMEVGLNSILISS